MKGEAFTHKMLVFREIYPKSDAVKAKNKNYLMRVTRARWAIAAVRSRCTFEEVLPIVVTSLQMEDESKRMAGVQQKTNPGAGQKQKFESLKAACYKRNAYFCTYRLTLRSSSPNLRYCFF